MKIKLILSMIASILILGVGSFISLNTSSAIKTSKKITICHATNAVTNPYVEVRVDIDAADNHDNRLDHQRHVGPIFTDGLTEWGDIIPPIEGNMDGLNWNEFGAAIYNNGCKMDSDISQSSGLGYSYNTYCSYNYNLDVVITLEFTNTSLETKEFIIDGLTSHFLLPGETKTLDFPINSVVSFADSNGIIFSKSFSCVEYAGK
jgi:hypothetical protein